MNTIERLIEDIDKFAQGAKILDRSGLLKYIQNLEKDILDIVIPFLSGTAGSQWLYGSGAPVNSDGVDGNFYLDKDNGDIYLKEIGVWSFQGNVSSGYVGSTITVTLSQYNTLKSGNALIPMSRYRVTGCGSTSILNVTATAISTNSVSPNVIIDFEQEFFDPGNPYTVVVFSVYEPSGSDPYSVYDKRGNLVMSPFTEFFPFGSDSTTIFAGSTVSTIQSQFFSSPQSASIIDSHIERLAITSDDTNSSYEIVNSTYSAGTLNLNGVFVNASRITGSLIRSSNIEFKESDSGQILNCTILNAKIRLEGNASISNCYIVGDGLQGQTIVFESGDVVENETIIIGRYSTAKRALSKDDNSPAFDDIDITGSIGINRNWLGFVDVSYKTSATFVENITFKTSIDGPLFPIRFIAQNDLGGFELTTTSSGDITTNSYEDKISSTYNVVGGSTVLKYSGEFIELKRAVLGTLKNWIVSSMSLIT
jgi:hypothetical protein